jgi:hypothetical protein
MESASLNRRLLIFHSRSLRTRCDGKERCANCVSRGTACCYTPSKRGGPRTYKKKAKAGAEPNQSEAQNGKGNEKQNVEMAVDLNWNEDGSLVSSR